MFSLKFNIILVLEGLFLGFSFGFNCDNIESQTCFINNSDCVCNCRPGYLDIEAGDVTACARVKTFGGMITFINLTSVDENQARTLVQQALEVMFNDSRMNKRYFLGANVVSLPSGSMVATYELLYRNSANVRVDYVKTIFNAAVNCTNSQIVVNSLSVDLAQTCSTAVSNDSSLLCNTSFRSYCDQSSTDCLADDDGYVTCPCKANFVPYNSTMCISQQHYCAFDEHCNHPFGSCALNTLSGALTCSCTWGVTGVSCEQAWMLIFTVVTTISGVIIVCLLAVVIIYIRKTRRLSENTCPTFNPAIVGPKYSFSNFPPGAMRARYPESTAHGSFADIRNKIASSSASMPAAISDGSGPGKQRKYSYLNHAFDSQEEESSVTNSPKKVNIEVEPNNYF